MPKISVVTICRNEIKGIEKTMTSVLSQTFKNFEYIVVDGQSTDGTLDIIQKFKSQLSHFSSGNDGGIYEAQNKGLSFAKGDYVLFLNGGDYLVDDKVFADLFSQNPIEDIVYGDMKIVEVNGKVADGYSPENIDLYHLIHGTLWHPVAFIKRQLFERYGNYKTDFRIVADYEFFLRTICVHQATTRHVKRFITAFNTEGVGSSEDHREQHEEERKRAQLKNFPEPVLKTILAYRALNESGVRVRFKFFTDGLFQALKRRLLRLRP